MYTFKHKPLIIPMEVVRWRGGGGGVVKWRVVRWRSGEVEEW